MRRAGLLLVLLFIGACSQPPSAVSSSSRTASPSAPTPVQATPTPAPAIPGVYAVMEKGFLVEPGPDYTVYLVATDGRLAASATARRRSVTPVQIANLSTSSTTLYYLDGDSDVRFLRPDGATGIATHIALRPHQVVAFAVSPDDVRIAVSVLDYTRYPVSTRLFVENLAGGGNHVELFKSLTVLEWPAGWHKGHLVIATGSEVPPQNFWEGFRYGHGYHLADAQTGVRIQSLCDGVDSSFPESPAGTVCGAYPSWSVTSWDGVTRPSACSGPLSPDGVTACGQNAEVSLVNADGTTDPRVLAHRSWPQGWIDSNLLFVSGDQSIAIPGQPLAPAAAIVDVTSGAVVTAQAPGFFAAALPGGL